MMACPYCVKHKWFNNFNGNNLKLEREPSYEEVIESIGDPKKYNEVVFCGYGDSLINLEIVKEIARWINRHYGKVRINTAGLANRYYGRNILPELKEFVDVISISLNGSNSREYNELNKPMFKEESFDEVIEFAKKAKDCIPEVVITAVESLGFDVLKVEEIAKKIGVKFRMRCFLGNEE
jgi:TatD DNase family protein